MISFGLLRYSFYCTYLLDWWAQLFFQLELDLGKTRCVRELFYLTLFLLRQNQFMILTF